VVPLLAQMVVDAGGSAAIAFGSSHSEPHLYAAGVQSQYPGVKLFSFPYSFPKRFSRSVEFSRWLRKRILDYDVLHIHSIYSFMVLDAARIAVASGVPYILRPHGSLHPFDLRKKKLIKYTVAAPIVRWCLEHATFVHCTSEMELKNMEKFGAATRDRVVPLPVNGQQFPGDRKRFRSRLRVSEDEFVFLFLSRVDYNKGLRPSNPCFFPIMQFAPGSKISTRWCG